MIDSHSYLTQGDHYALLNGAIDLSRQRLKAVQHARAYLTRGDHYALPIEQLAKVSSDLSQCNMLAPTQYRVTTTPY